MENPTFDTPAELADILDLGITVGQNQAFGLISGRCSAAQAESLWRLREEKKYQKYQKCTPNWREFCPKYLKMSSGHADRIIRLWEEFGAGYFELAQLTRVSPETYRALEPSVRDGTLHVNGEAIKLDPEIARKVSDAVMESRRPAPAKKPARPLETHERLAELDRRCAAIAAEFEEISRKERHGENWLLFTSVLERITTRLKRIERENGI